MTYEDVKVEEQAEPEPAPEPEPERQAQVPEDPWAGPCPKCGLVGCVRGHY